MAPINLPDGTEVSEVILPDGASASAVIGPDGSTVFSAIPDSGLSYYNFEQSVDDSWNDNDGTNNGVTYTTNSAVDQYAGVFDGSSEVDISGFGISGSASIAVYVYADSDFSTGTEIIFWGDAPPHFELQWRNGSVEGFYFDGSSQIGTVNSDQPAGQYIHVCYVWRDGTEAELFINGSSVGTASHSTNVSFNGSASRLGAHGADVTNPWDGRLDAGKFFGKALSDSEVSNLFNTGSING